MVEGQGWAKAKFLKAGDQLRDSNENTINIENVDIVPLPENQYTLVYHFEVADFHTYFVSDNDVLVHNTCSPTKQQIANQVAKKYNAKYNPSQRAISKGYSGVIKTKNGGISFKGTNYVYKINNKKEAIVRIKATGNRQADFDAANKKLKLNSTPNGYVWHHVDNYNVRYNSFTLELVEERAHKAAIPHSGACAQYDAVYGPTYNK